MSRMTLDAAVEALGRQDGRGVPRRALVALAGAERPVSAALARPAGRDARFAALTPRERQVAALVAAGCSNREIADRLVISMGTVKDHVHHLLTKSGLKSRAAVAARWRS